MINRLPPQQRPSRAEPRAAARDFASSNSNELPDLARASERIVRHIAAHPEQAMIASLLLGVTLGWLFKRR